MLVDPWHMLNVATMKNEMVPSFSQSELECYLDEALAPEEMARIEAALRAHPELSQQLVEIHRRRDAGVHSLGEIWRRHRISCPTREQLGSFLLGALDEGNAEYVRFHIQYVGCRLCSANLDDMDLQQKKGAEANARRRQKYFQSSAEYLQSRDD